ncbi:MAG: methionine biosynthesis protein MetW [Candidatus Paceibacterota bacterium]|jgi:methionine biosynthesis protein MetW
MNTKAFEENRWKTLHQKTEFRHRAAVSLIEGGTVLDVGCGDGLLLRMLRDRGIEGRGLDLSETAVELCRKDGFDVCVGDFTQRALPFADDSIDYVVALDVLEHLYAPEILVKEMARVARVAVVLGVPNFSSLPARLQVLVGGVPENNRPKKGHLYWFNHDVLRELCASAGAPLEVCKMNTFFPFSLFGTEAPFMPNLLALSFVVVLPKNSV